MITNTFKKIKKEHILLLITGFFCIIGFLTLLFIFFSRTSTTQQEQVTPKQTIEPNRSSESILKFQSGTRGKLYDKLTSDRVLSETDKEKRALIISEIGNKSGTLYSSPNVLLGYLSSPDFFQADILTSNVDLAKKEAVDWFLSKGLSKEGTCNLPIMFLLNQETTSEFINSGRKFNPLAPGC